MSAIDEARSGRATPPRPVALARASESYADAYRTGQSIRRRSSSTWPRTWLHDVRRHALEFDILHFHVDLIAWAAIEAQRAHTQLAGKDFWEPGHR